MLNQAKHVPLAGKQGNKYCSTAIYEHILVQKLCFLVRLCDEFVSI